MDSSVKTGLYFGLTSGIITTLGLMIGLESGTGSRAVVIGGIITIAIADAFSDALGIHMSEESENVHTDKEVWTSTITTFFSKFLFALTFIVPVLFLPLTHAILAGAAWGLTALIFLSYMISKDQGKSTLNVASEHLLIAIAVIITTHYVGHWVGETFM